MYLKIIKFKLRSQVGLSEEVVRGEMGTRRRGEFYSSVERYRRGELEESLYDLSDPLDRSIWYALQAYVDYLETLDLERDTSAREDSNVYGRFGTKRLTARSPFLLEVTIRRLRAWERGEEPMGAKDLYDAARKVLEALFSPARNLRGEAVAWGEGEYGVARVLWDAGEEDAKAAERRPKPLTLVAHEPPLLVPERAAPLFGLLCKSVGELVTQSEAARRLNLTPAGVALRIERGEMEHLRVGGSVMIPEWDVRVTKEERLRARTRLARS